MWERKKRNNFLIQCYSGLFSCLWHCTCMRAMCVCLWLFTDMSETRLVSQAEKEIGTDICAAVPAIHPRTMFHCEQICGPWSCREVSTKFLGCRVTLPVDSFPVD